MRVVAADFIHPEDAAAMEQLQSVPMFDGFTRAFLKLYPEPLFRSQLLSQAIRLGPRQLPEIHAHLVDCCGVLELDVPEMFLQSSGAVNAYSMGDTDRFVVVTSELVEACEPDELRAVIAHEVGHLVCRHTLYKTMTRLLMQVGTGVFGPLAAAAVPIQVALTYWSRRSELSADRAAAVVLGGPGPVVETMIRLAGGPRAVTGGVDLGEYLRQADDFEAMGDDTWDRLIQLVAVMDADHPFNAVRAREIMRWCETDAYARLAAAVRQRREAPRCPECGRSVEAGWRFCFHCGTALADA